MEMELFDPPEPDRTGGRGARAGSAGSTSGPSAPRGAEKDVPLADRMRPRTIDEVLGQDRLLGPGKVLRRAIERDEVRSVIFWGPPGTGKTTLARIIAQRTGAHFITLSAVLHGVKDLRAGIDEARAMRRRGRKTILFIDEIHRFNKAQQDGLLPSVEDGTVILIGATTENPSFEIIAALLSRARVFVLEALGESSLLGLLQGALEDKERGLGRTGLRAEEDALRRIASLASGDARAALNILELAAAIALVAGFVAAFFGIGGGIINVPVMMLVLKMPSRMAIATSQLELMVASAAALLVHLTVTFGEWDPWIRGLILGVGTLIGAQIGVRAAGMASGRIILLIIATVLFLSGARQIIASA